MKNERATVLLAGGLMLVIICGHVSQMALDGEMGSVLKDLEHPGHHGQSK